MEPERYNLHRDLIGMPSCLGAMAVGFAFNSWWLGILLVLASVPALRRPYRAYFSDAQSHPRRRNIATNLWFIAAQVVFWAGILYGLYFATKAAHAI